MSYAAAGPVPAVQTPLTSLFVASDGAFHVIVAQNVVLPVLGSPLQVAAIWAASGAIASLQGVPTSSRKASPKWADGLQSLDLSDSRTVWPAIVDRLRTTCSQRRYTMLAPPLLSKPPRHHGLHG